jgi:hypothetical protein
VLEFLSALSVLDLRKNQRLIEGKELEVKRNGDIRACCLDRRTLELLRLRVVYFDVISTWRVFNRGVRTTRSVIKPRYRNKIL